MSGDGNSARSNKGAYHHGDLRAALLAAAEEILAERGTEGFTLRECARRAGVSHAAPAHHFGDVTGLLTAVAILGFEALTASMREARAGIEAPRARLRAIGQGYVAFARRYPERFHLIFSHHRLNKEDPALLQAGQAAFAELESAIRLVRNLADGPLDAPAQAELLHAWSVVHGFAHLSLSGQFDQSGVDAAEAALVAILDRI